MDEQRSSKKAKLLKAAAVFLAVIFIIVAYSVATERERRAEEEARAEEERLEKLPDTENAKLAAIIPDIPPSASMNSLTKDECERAAADGSMIKLISSSGALVYVRNYHDEALLKAALSEGSDTPEENFKSFLYEDFCVYDIDENRLIERYKIEFSDYAKSIKNDYGLSVIRYLEAYGYDRDEYLAGIMNTALHFVRDMEMAEAVLNDTIGDVSDEEIEAFALENKHESLEVFIERYGRDSILYYLRPQKLLTYIDSRLKELGY